VKARSRSDDVRRVPEVDAITRDTVAKSAVRRKASQHHNLNDGCDRGLTPRRPAEERLRSTTAAGHWNGSQRLVVKWVWQFTPDCGEMATVDGTDAARGIQVRRLTIHLDERRAGSGSSAQ